MPRLKLVNRQEKGCSLAHSQHFISYMMYFFSSSGERIFLFWYSETIYF